MTPERRPLTARVVAAARRGGRLARRLAPGRRQAPAAPPPSHLDNVAYNRYLWERYAHDWSDPAAPFYPDAEARDDLDRLGSAAILGDEWGNRRSVDEVVQRCILAHVTKESDVAEIGSGAGRIALRVVDHVGSLLCLDLAPAMLAMSRDALAGHSNVEYELVSSLPIRGRADGSLDFVYSFDVFVHLDVHTQWGYLREISRLLRVGGRAFLHTANLLAPDGWKRFSAQAAFTVDGHYFIVPAVLAALLDHLPLRILEEPVLSPDNFYHRRDYLVVLERIDAPVDHAAN